MNRFKISTRLTLMLGVMVLLLIAGAAMGLSGISRADDSVKAVYENGTVHTAKIADIQARLLENRLAITVSLVTPDEPTIKAQTARVEANIAAINQDWEQFLKSTQLDADEERHAHAFSESRKKFVQEGLLPAVAALRAKDIEGANRIVVEKVRPLYAPVEGAVKALLQAQIDGAKHEYTEAEDRYAVISAVAISGVVLGIIFQIGLGVMLIKGINRSLAHAVDASNAVARGDLTFPITPTGNDEVTRLVRALLAMRDNLANVVGAVRASAESVATASSQIAQGNNDLAGRTEEQASALQQTAASMEQLGSTVQQNADNARQANQLAQGASSVATKGGEVVNRVVSTMRDIHGSSHKISEIITVIDSIAFQTNILALNAAVEAARAGEQGRGFAVVAGEVRSLAQRSAEAAKEIKALITTSVDQVAQGTRLVGEAGTTMQELVTAVQRVSDIMGEISAASLEQSAGVTQIGEAVTQMDRVTQQNAALVEEASAAAESMRSQAQRLVEAVGAFRIGGHTPTTQLAAASAPVAAPQPRPHTMPAPKRVLAPVSTSQQPPTAAAPSAVVTDEWESF